MEKLDIIVKTLEDKLAEDVNVIKLEDSSVADYFEMCIRDRSYVAYAVKTEKNIENIYEACKVDLEKYFSDKPYTFKVETKRTDKAFEYKSPELSAKIGGFILRDFPNLKVDVHNPCLLYTSTKSVYELAKEKNIDLPITNEIYQVLFNNKDCNESVKDLMMREIKSEF